MENTEYSVFWISQKYKILNIPPFAGPYLKQFLATSPAASNKSGQKWLETNHLVSSV